MGGLSIKLSRMRKRRTSSAATRIQSAFRMRKSRLRISALRARRQGMVAASKIQAVTRGHRSREKTRALLSKRSKECAACTKIQAASRGHVCRVKSRVLLIQRQERSTATGIQALFRGHRSRVNTRNLRAERRAAATRIQSLLLHHRRKTTQHAFRCERERSVLIVQRAWRKLRTSGYANAQRGSASATWASSKTRRTLDRGDQLVLEALANGVASCSARTPNDARQLRKELVLREDDPVLKTLVCQRLSGLETSLTASCKFDAYKPTVIPTAQGGNGEEELLQSLRLLEVGLMRPSD